MTSNSPHHVGLPGGASNIPNALSLILGIWLFVSPWIYGAHGNAGAWNSWIAGALIVLLAAVRFGTAPAPLKFLHTVLGIWIFVSPWVYGYAGNTGRLINSLCVGTFVFYLSISAIITKTKTVSRA